MPVNEPIFLVGAERSGTTLLRLLLDHHPRIAFHMEFEYAVDRLDGEGWPDVAEYREFLVTNYVFQSAPFEIDESLSFPELLNDFLEQKRGNAEYVGATVHRHFSRLLKLWPDARFIYLQRDGRDVARSTVGMRWAGNVYHGCDNWIEAVEGWKEMRALVPEHRLYELRYEDLVSDYKAELTPLCEWIGVQYDDAMLDYTNTTHYGPPDPKLAYQWKKKMTDYDIRLVEARIGGLLVERGYELSGLPPLTVTPAMARRLELQSRIKRYRERFQRYGFLLVGETITRRMNLKRLNTHFAQRIYDIDHYRFSPARHRQDREEKTSA